jgi:hypothetical protein
MAGVLGELVLRFNLRAHNKGAVNHAERIAVAFLASRVRQFRRDNLHRNLLNSFAR